MPQTKTIHCLSVRQPFASLIVYASKWCENRTWRTPHRGPLWIHASSWQPGLSAEQRVAFQFPVPTGAIIGCVDLLGCWSVDDVFDEVRSPTGDESLDAAVRQLSEIPFNFFGWEECCGPECWLMANRRPLLKPIESGGKLRIWKTEVAAELLELETETIKPA